MPIELRKIIFDVPELQEAIVAYNRGCKNKLPPGELRLLEIAGGEDAHAWVEVANSSTGETNTRRLNASYLAAALLVYCKRYQIPIPRSFDKSLKSHDGKLMFDLKNVRKPRPIPAEEPASQPAA